MERVDGRPELYELPDGQSYQVYNGRLFCINTGKYYESGKFSKRQRRAYMRLKSGLTLGDHRKERLCFMTLSTQYDLSQPEKRLNRIKKLNYAFTKLKQKTERYLQSRTYEKYCRRHKLEPYEIHGCKKSVKYLETYKKFRFKFKYFKVKTSEGGGVLHIAFRKAWYVPKIPYEWLSKQWVKIWGAWNVSISQIKPRNVDRLSMYMVGQYFAKQSVLRMSYGQSWVYLGFRKTFQHLIEVYGYKHALGIWQKLLCHARDLPDPGRPRRFRHRRLPAKTQGVVGLQHWDCTTGGYRWRRKSFQSQLDDPVYHPLPGPGFAPFPSALLGCPSVEIDPDLYDAFLKSLQ